MQRDHGERRFGVAAVVNLALFLHSTRQAALTENRQRL
jgi:hypothetical protein